MGDQNFPKNQPGKLVRLREEREREMVRHGEDLRRLRERKGGATETEGLRGGERGVRVRDREGRRERGVRLSLRETERVCERERGCDRETKEKNHLPVKRETLFQLDSTADLLA